MMSLRNSKVSKNLQNDKIDKKHLKNIQVLFIMERDVREEKQGKR